MRYSYVYIMRNLNAQIRIYMFEIGSYVVCPGHGVGQVLNLEAKDLGEETNLRFKFFFYFLVA